MAWFNRIVVATLILCLSSTLLPWEATLLRSPITQGFAHSPVVQAASHSSKLPLRQSWHFAKMRGVEDADEMDRKLESLMVCAESQTLMPRATVLSAASPTLSRPPRLATLEPAAAAWSQQTYLRISMLLI